MRSRVRDRWLQTWLFAVLAAFCFALFVTRSHFSWFHDPTSFWKRIGAVQEKAIDARPNARIIILGTSNAAFGLAPSKIESVLDRPAASVANWSFPGFGLATYEALVNANRDKIAGAAVLVLGIDPYFLLTPRQPGVPPENAGPVARNWALEADQAIRQHVRSIAPVAANMAWFLRELGGQLRLVAPFRLASWTMLPQGSWDSRAGNRVLSDHDARAESDRIAQNYFKNKVIAPGEIARWKAFLRSLTALNPRVILVDLPASPAFGLAEPQYADVIGENRKVFEDLATEHGLKLIDITAADCGLDDDLFADPVHTNHRGTERLSECFARRLRTEFPDLE